MDWRMNVMLLDILLFPFTLAGWLIRGVLGLVGGLIGAVGGLLGLIFGLGMTVIGIVLCVSLIGWIFGIPLLALLGTALSRLGLRRG